MNAQKMSRLKCSPDRIDQSSLVRNHVRNLIRAQNELFFRCGFHAVDHLTERMEDSAGHQEPSLGNLSRANRAMSSN